MRPLPAENSTACDSDQMRQRGGSAPESSLSKLNVHGAALPLAVRKDYEAKINDLWQRR
jgi:hypothetical protein